jgi:PKD repeat protein
VCPDSLSAGIEIEILTTVDSIAFFGIWNGPSATVFTPGTYGVVVTDSNGCTASDVTVIEVLDTAVASFYPLVTGTTVAFINTSNFGDVFEWDFGDGSTDSSPNPVHLFESVDTFTVQLIVINACGADTTILEVVTSAIAAPVNNTCPGAFDLGVLPVSLLDCQASPEPLHCTTRTNLWADPDSNVLCSGLYGPVVWFQFQTDDMASVLNLHITNSAIESPFVQLYHSVDGTCDNLGQPVPLSKSFLECARGGGGKLSVQGTAVVPSSTYYLVVGSVDTTGGIFELCLGTVEMTSSPCVTDASLEVVSRSAGGTLQGPFLSPPSRSPAP